MRKIATLFIALVMFASTFLVVRVASLVNVAPPDNEVIPLHLNSTLWGIEQAMSSASGTYTLTRGKDCVLFVWQVGDGWAFAGINIEKARAMKELATIAKGNVVNANTMNDLVEWLESNGWTVVPSGGLSAATRAFITASIQATASSMPTFLVLPAGMLLPPEELERYRMVEVWQ
jgi:hypothetical protein